ncbi:type 2 lanthipeptide synthetase LanM family protein [Mangrovibacillus sp. Mu-81]|uniref:type 2 lanthipeptide synthetase LanM family protein n=1 Tax=Mangrovibacillus sp. Mu-81 TaxID=3121478 RepID=UPI002FE49556
MITTDLKIENWKKATYLHERIPVPAGEDLGRSNRLAVEWLKKSGLQLVALQKRLENKGISHDQFLSLLENKNSPSTKKADWLETLQDILYQNDSATLKDNVNNADTGLFILPFTSYFVKGVQEHFSGYKVSHIDLNSFINSCEKYLFHELKQVSDKTVVLEFHNLKEQLSKEYHTFDFQYYKEVYLTDIQFIHKILETYPVMARILTEVTVSTIENVKNLITRYDKDYQEISTSFFHKEVILKAASFGLGDSHNNGQTVAVLMFEDGEKLVYKPRSLSIDNAFNRLLDWINQEGLSYRLTNGTSISYDKYGWQQFIEPKACLNKDEVHQYYFRMGALIAVFHLLRTNDMHYENIIASGPVPYVIDLETLFSNSLYSDKILKYPRKELLKTVLSSGVLPTGHVFNSKIDFDPSALAGRPEQTSQNMKGWVMVEDENGDYKYENRSFVTSHEGHLVQLDNKIIRPVEFVEDLTQGFEEVYRVLMNRKKELFDKVVDLFGESRCRIVLRPTFMYSRFLIASHHPTYLENGLDREELLEMLWNIVKSEERYSGIVESEIEDLLNNDVPYFSYSVDSRNLFDSKGREIQDVFDQTSLEMVEAQINLLSEENLKEQLQLMKLSIHANAVSESDVNEVEAMASVKTPVFIKEETISFLSMAENIGDFLMDQAVKDLENKYVSWVGVENVNNQFQFKALDFSLYNGMLGMTLFLGQLYQYIPKENYKTAIYNTVQYLHETMKDVSGVMTNSVFNGIGSFAYSLYSLSSLLKDKKFEVMGYDYLLMLEDLKKEESDKKDGTGTVQSETQIDFLDGHAGVITFAVNLYEQFEVEKALTIAKNYGNDLMEILETTEVENLLLGLAHGTSGLIMALEKLGSITRDQDMMDMADRLLIYEDEHFDHEKLNWLDLRKNVTEKTKSYYWCHGAPGVLLARSSLEGERALTNVLQPEIIENFVNNHIGLDRIGLCHGLFGNLDILIDLAKKYPEQLTIERIKGIADEYLQNEITQSKIQGLKDRGIIGLMLGVSGVGYSLLRLHDPDHIPSVLALELPGVRMNTL